MEDSKLLNTLQALVKTISGHAPSEETVEELRDVIENSYLDESLKVPSWLLDMFAGLVEKRTIAPTMQTAAEQKGASPNNFLVELADVIDMNWVEFGEYFLMQFSSIGLEAKVSLQDNTYEVRPITSA